jgi:uncharacterized protein (DUF305 family)
VKSLQSRAGRGLALAFITIALTACARASATPAPVPDDSVLRVKHGDREAIARAREDSVRIPYTAADVHFMTGMISHHAQALAMSKMAPTHGASSSIRTLAARIINAQADEIVIMQQWLADREKPVPEPDPAGMKMNMGGMDHVHLMPGMLTADQMKQLDAARGKTFDRLFLQFMIQHHRGAVEMVQELFSTYASGQNDVVFKFASDVNTDQTTEIARMERMLEALKP